MGAGSFSRGSIFGGGRELFVGAFGTLRRFGALAASSVRLWILEMLFRLCGGWGGTFGMAKAKEIDKGGMPFLIGGGMSGMFASFGM